MHGLTWRWNRRRRWHCSCCTQSLAIGSSKKKTMATLVLASFPCFFLFSSLLFPSFYVLLSFSFFLFLQSRTKTHVLCVLSARLLAVFFCSFLSVFLFFLCSFFLLFFSWKLVLGRTKTTGVEASALSQWLMLMGTAKQIGHAGFGLWSFSLLLLMLSSEMTKMMAMKVCCAGGVVALASVFFLAFDSVLLMAFSALPLSRFLLSFFSRFSLFSPFFFCFFFVFLYSLLFFLFFFLPLGQ